MKEVQINERGTERLKLINGDMLRHIGGLGPFDLAVSTYTLELIPKESLFQVVESMVQTISVKGNLILSDIKTDEADSLLPFLSGQFTNVDVLYYQTLKSQEFENKTGNRSLSDPENLYRLTGLGHRIFL